MNQSIIPSRHPDPWVDFIRSYVTLAALELLAGGLDVKRSHLDPRDPRDATIVCASPTRDSPGQEEAFVWDEVTGWRRGRYLGGRQGVRTELADVSYLGGGVLLDPAELANRAVKGVTAPRPRYRSAVDVRDGLDDALREIL